MLSQSSNSHRVLVRLRKAQRTPARLRPHTTVLSHEQPTKGCSNPIFLSLGGVHSNLQLFSPSPSPCSGRTILSVLKLDTSEILLIQLALPGFHSLCA